MRKKGQKRTFNIIKKQHEIAGHEEIGIVSTLCLPINNPIHKDELALSKVVAI